VRLASASAGAVAAALLLAGAARAHIDVFPTFVPTSGTAVLSLTAHNDRDEPMTAFAVTVPSGLRIASGEPFDDWQVRAEGATVTWSGGNVPPDDDATFDVELESSLEPGSAELAVEQLYPGNAVARWPVRLTVVPATVASSEEADYPWWAIGVLVVLALAAVALVAVVLGAMRKRRARILQER
jgi:hypothetical protein